MTKKQTDADEMAAIPADNDMAAWRAEWDAWAAWLDAEMTAEIVFCPYCGAVLLPVADGRAICPDCGHEEEPQ